MRNLISNSETQDVYNSLQQAPPNSYQVKQRNFKDEKVTLKYAEATEILLESLKFPIMLQVLFSRAVIHSGYIHFRDLIILLMPIMMKVYTGGQMIWGKFRPGTVLRMINNRVELVFATKHCFISPILEACAAINGCDIINVAQFIIEEARKREFTPCESMLDFLKVAPPRSPEDVFVRDFHYLRLEPVDYMNNMFYPIFVDWIPVQFQHPAGLVVDDNSGSCQYIQPERVYSFVNRHSIPVAEAYGYVTGYPKISILPVTCMKCNTTGLSVIIFQGLGEITPPFNANYICQCPEHPVLLTNSLQYADSLTKNQISRRECRYIPTSWLQDYKHMDLEDFKGKRVFLALTQMEGHSREELVNMAIYFHNKLKNVADIKFLVDEGVGFSYPMEWKELSEYYKKRGISLPSDGDNFIQMLEKGRLKPNDQIADRPVVIEGFAKLGKIMVMAGGSKTGKSLIAFRFAHQISIGGAVWEHKMNKMKVLYFDTEMDEDDYKSRSLADMQHEGFKVFLAGDLSNPEGVDIDKPLERLKHYLSMITSYVLENNFQVVFIDCIYKLLDENNAQHTSVFINALKALKNRNILVFAVHHINKKEFDEADPFKSVSGHSNLIRGIDGGLLLFPDGFIDSMRRIRTVYLARSMPPIEDKTIYLKDMVHLLESELDVDISKSKDEKLIEFIRNNLPESPENALVTGDVISMMSKSKPVYYAKSTLQKKLPEWVAAGLLNVTGYHPKYYYQGPEVAQNK